MILTWFKSRAFSGRQLYSFTWEPDSAISAGDNSLTTDFSSIENIICLMRCVFGNNERPVAVSLTRQNTIRANYHVHCLQLKRIIVTSRIIYTVFYKKWTPFCFSYNSLNLHKIFSSCSWKNTNSKYCNIIWRLINNF